MGKTKYVVYAIADEGEGKVQEIGRYDSVDEIKIRVGMFAKDVVISIEEVELNEE